MRIVLHNVLRHHAISKDYRGGEATYQLKGDAVVIRDGFCEPMILNLESVKLAIETIKAARPTYATMAAYERHLSKCKGALAFLEVNLKST